MTPEEARKVAPKLKKMTDEGLTEAIRLLDELAEITIHDWITRHPGSINVDRAQEEDYGTTKRRRK